MDHRNHKRSFSRARDSFPLIPPGRTSLSSSTEMVTSQRPLSGIRRQTSYRHTPCPPLTESTERQWPNSGHSPTSFGGEINRQRPGSGQKMTTLAMTESGHTYTALELEDKETRAKLEMLYKCANRDLERLKSYSVQQYGNEFIQTPNLSSCSSESPDNPPPTPVIIDVKAEKRRKRKEKKEAKKMEEERKKEQEKLETERMMAELSRNRSMFNGNKDTLPAIGRKMAEVNFCIQKLPKIQEYEIIGPSLPDNNAVDVIKKHDAIVLNTAFAKKISQDYINASAELMKPYNKNEAIDVVEKHEEEVGRIHAMYTGSYATKNACHPASARSRCSSGVSRRTAF
ncbi:uncharacterized protein LOC123538948 [Mercenaria mercenaria]|uniref:uncharacterized protein LOC123538948 n=1 Tax=Mercenaria mercenaria TaxID=6596 RepID=UPI00234F9808|nr:uncharacterized protein LOC123538948 [Mercenaria mercenaria]